MKRNTFADFSNLVIALALLAGALPVVAASSADLPPLPPIPAPTNVLEFATAHFLVSETNSTVTIKVLRRGDTNSTASVNFGTRDGTARAGHNYLAAKGTLTFAKGDAEKTFAVGILNDPKTEPDEFFYVVLNQASGGAVLGAVTKATVTIFHVKAAVTLPPVVNVLSPTNGQTFRVDAEIRVVAHAEDPDGLIKSVEFFANGKSLGVATNNPASASPVGVFQLAFKKATPGAYILTATATDNLGATAISPPVIVRVLAASVPNVVTISASDPVASELNPRDSGKFTVRRTGSLQTKLNVRYSISGTASNSLDYEKLSGLVVIPAGVASANIKATPIPDKAIEGDETVTLKLQQLVFIAQPPLEDDYTVGQPDSATVTITEKPIANLPPKVDITSPKNGDTFNAAANLVINAATADADGTVEIVSFFADGKLIGVDTKPPFTIPWNNVKAGRYTLVAEARDDRGAVTKSVPVEIKVIEANATPTVTIVATDKQALEANPKDKGIFRVMRTRNLRTKLNVQYSVSGSAQNGVDYEKLSGLVTIPAGEDEAEIKIVPIPDQLAEGNETVVVTLTQLFFFVKPAPEDDYFVGSPKSATVAIVDGSAPNPQPGIQITSPKSDSVFPSGSDIVIVAQVTDAAGPVKQISFFNGNQFIGVDTQPPYSVVWSNVPPGTYKLGAAAIDGSGTTITSPGVVVFVKGSSAIPFVKRRLPSGYVPDQTMQVFLQTGPNDNVVVHAVEEDPPSGWVVAAISDGGVFDAIRGRVKFGPFFDNQSRALTYELTPPKGESGIKIFHGFASSDGVDSPIVGDDKIGTFSLHPADTDPANHRITLAELTAYSAAWKKSEPWPVGPNPIPLSYVTRAGELWKNGEEYVFDPLAGPAPLWWVSKNGLRPQAVTKIVASVSPEFAHANSVKRFVVAGSPVRDVVEVDLAVVPRPGVSAHAIEETIPAGWTVANISSEGVLDDASRTIRWGVFYDGQSRNLNYRLVRSEAAITSAVLVGRAAFDGSEVAVEAAKPSALPVAMPTNLRRAENGECQISFRAETGRRYLVQASADLIHWSDVDVFVAKDGLVETRDSAASHMSQCFYRAVPQD